MIWDGACWYRLKGKFCAASTIFCVSVPNAWWRFFFPPSFLSSSISKLNPAHSRRIAFSYLCRVKCVATHSWRRPRDSRREMREEASRGTHESKRERERNRLGYRRRVRERLCDKKKSFCMQLSSCSFLQFNLLIFMFPAMKLALFADAWGSLKSKTYMKFLIIHRGINYPLPSSNKDE